MGNRINGTKWDFVKMKLGWLDKITFAEWMMEYQERHPQ